MRNPVNILLFVLLNMCQYLYMSACVILVVSLFPIVYSLPLSSPTTQLTQSLNLDLHTEDNGVKAGSEVNNGVKAGSKVNQVSPCIAVIDGKTFNLEPLQSMTGRPRFRYEDSGWLYTYNPCVSYNNPAHTISQSNHYSSPTDQQVPEDQKYQLPTNDYSDQLDGCYHVAFCLSEVWAGPGRPKRHYTLGLQRTAWIALTAYDPTSKSLPLVNIANNTRYSDYLAHLDTIDESSSSASSENEDTQEKINDNSKISDENKALESGHVEELEQLAKNNQLKQDDYDNNIDDDNEQDKASHSSTSNKKSRQIDVSDLDNNSQISSNVSELGDKHNNNSVILKVLASQNTDIEEDLNINSKSNDKNMGVKNSKSNENISNAQVKSNSGKKSANDEYINYDEMEISELHNDKYILSDSEEIKMNIVYKYHPAIYMGGLRYGARRRLYGAAVILVCDKTRKHPNDALFTRLNATSTKVRPYFELRHICCCPDGCSKSWSRSGQGQTEPEGAGLILSDYSRWDNDRVLHLKQELILINETRLASGDSTLSIKGRPLPRYLWVILVINGSILFIAVVVAATCCRQGKRGAGLVTGGQYTYLPAIRHGNSRMTLASATCATDSRYVSTIRLASADYKEYSSSRLHSSRLPVLDNCVINNDQIIMGQRLGGGVFCDTYVAEWKKRAVTVKRLIVGGHKGTALLKDSDHDWLIDEVSFLSQQRHGALVSVLGVCLGGRHPHIVMEFISGGVTLSEYCRSQTEAPSLQKCVKMCVSVAEGMAFLHSATPPILHRDLRGGNVLVDRVRGKVKITDYGLTRILQRQRADCEKGASCYCQPTTCAHPPTIRWTAPEVLAHPQADEEGVERVFSPSCDSYSYGMLLWEVVALCDPFDDINSESQVVELVLGGARPNLDALVGVAPHYKRIMSQCWDQSPEKRPPFIELESMMKQLVGLVSKSSQRRERCDSYDSTATSYLRSALNLTA